ncbi:hypothetical protein IFM89_003657 [Coptis chinensis]|uniref:Glycosyltransferase n=1 Tax=Coptis chinensis TaxID=261450 RepID=A0A835HGC0_9MAGN|nr:hypothetical protein IFM89_003657 [Coptis chinensis]
MEPSNLHIFFIPFMAPGHMNPLIDMARLFAAQGVKCTIITTPLNASRYQSIINQETQSGLYIRTQTIQFPPSSQTQLPENCENVDLLPSRDLTPNFAKATTLLQAQTDDLVRAHLPDAVISDLNLPWTAEIARKYDIPRITFHGTCCFALSVTISVNHFMPHANITSDSEPFLVPGLPDPVYVTKAQLPIRSMKNMGLHEFFQQVREADKKTLSAVVNSFDGLEPDYIKHYEKLTGKKVWTIGPVSFVNKDFASKSIRGNKSAIDEHQCIAWLDSKKPKSVLYVCFGSLCYFPKSQLFEIGSGLEESGCPFIWVIKDVDNGLPDGFEERVEGRGLIIKGWAPQVMILSHESVGGFMTHCGWNSVMESVSLGIPMITWPLFAEQFYNERFVLDNVKTGVGIGVERGFEWGEEDLVGVLVSKEQVKDVVTRFMSDGDEAIKQIKNLASKLGEMARSAVQEGGSSYVNLGLLIEDLLSKKKEKLDRI